MSCHFQILGVRWYHFVSNASVINQTGQDSLCIVGSAADAWQSLDMFVNSPKMFQRMLHSVWQWRWGQVVHLHTEDARVAVLAIPGPHRLNWTVDTALTSHGTWLVIVVDGGRYNPLPVKRISESVSEFHLYLLVINCDHAVSLKHLHSGDKGERTEMNGRNAHTHAGTDGRTTWKHMPLPSMAGTIKRGIYK